MPEDGFIWTSPAPNTREDSTFTLGLGAPGTDLRVLTNAISRESALDLSDKEPDRAMEDIGLMLGDEFWL